MQKSLMEGLTERDMKAVINTYTLKDYYYPTLFPIEKNLTFTWKTLSAQTGLKIAADIVARGASIDRKTRVAITRIEGDIPKIAISRTMEEDELNEYYIKLALAQGSADLQSLVKLWADDMKFCWDGVAAKLEWMALSQISKGKLTITAADNMRVLSEFDADYEIPTTQKVGYQTGSASWAIAASAKPITIDLKYIVATARALGFAPKKLYMNMTTFANFAQTEEVIKLCAGYAQNALSIAQTPDLATINATLLRIPYMYGIQIVVIDQSITIEDKSGIRTTANPFVDNVILLTEEGKLGQTYYVEPVDLRLQGSAAMKVMNGHTLIKKYSEENPLKEVTQGIANAFPAWSNSQRVILMDTTHTTWQY
jgi:hypothetical protein